MSIWFTKPELELLNGKLNKNMTHFLEIEFTESGDDWIMAKMPVGPKTTQPFDILHGGASCVLAETIGSVGSNLCIDPQTHYAVGLEINANHVKSATNGFVYAKASIVHQGRSTHIWDIKIHNEDKELVCISRLTMAIIKK